jgi:regulator of sigma E protease|tara:strand:+ start:5192 stop:6529 length:1338 start_codon:yes stop_codon:yes gene_type:complete
MEFLIKALQLIMSLSILVVLHELGHFIPAKIFKTKVEKFYLFFDPYFSLIKKKIGDTEYGIGWLPLGGYVKISGMIDESMDKEQMNKPPEPWEFRAKPAWQRLIIMLGGVTVNLLLGMFIYAMTLYAYGDKYLPNNNLADGIWCVDSLSKEIGFLSGDKIISVDGEPVERFSSILEKTLTAKQVTVERNSKKEIIEIPNDFIEKLISNEKTMLFYPRIPAIISSFVENSNCKEAGLKVKDQIIRVNDLEVKYNDQIYDVLAAFKDSTINITVIREGSEINFETIVNTDGTIGYYPALLSFTQLEELGIYKMEAKTYSLLSSFPAGYSKAMNKLGGYIDQFALILKPSSGAYKGVGGFGAIGGLFPAQWDWERFWNLTAFLSLMLAFMNILPIPALDGGHVVFLLYEIVAGKAAPEKIMEYAQVVGMIILLSLLVFANGNDILKLF